MTIRDQISIVAEVSNYNEAYCSSINLNNMPEIQVRVTGQKLDTFSTKIWAIFKFIFPKKIVIKGWPESLFIDILNMIPVSDIGGAAIYDQLFWTFSEVELHALNVKFEWHVGPGFFDLWIGRDPL